ncbi:MAG: response regulator [Lachnospiraceae bacterium]|nr:response regulator [Lachnospiraceae bacterium]
MKPKKKLIRQYAYAVTVFVVVTMAVSAIVTYFAQMKQYRELAKDRIRAVGDQLVAQLMEDPQDFLDHIKYYKAHYEDIRIPCDFNECVTARDEFFSSFRSEYHDKTFRTDVAKDEMPLWLQNLYYTYRHEYWMLAFEKAREAYGLPYTYFLLCDDDSHYTTYMIDGERTEDKEHPGYLYMGDSYFEEPSSHTLLWNTYHNGIRYDDVYEWNNEWGNTYSCYTPLMIDGKCAGLVVTEINVSDVDSMILKNTLLLILQLGVMLALLSAVLLFYINKHHIKRINHLSEQISDFASTRAYDTVDSIRMYSYGNDEIRALADNTADMIRELQIHEGKIAQAAQFKSDFLANMSHEIRTPMNAIIGLSELAAKEEDPDKKKQYIEQINASSNTMLVIINDILDFTQIEAGRTEIVPVRYDVKQTVREVVNVTAMGLGEKPVKMNLNVSPSIPQYLYGDSARIRQVLGNVISNAVKFTKEGSVTINLDHEPLEDGQINMKIRVADTGIGIMKQDYDMIFESFSQVDSKRNREAEGTGLGLAITKRLVRLMNGTIEVESEYGVGSVFKISIPQKIADSAEEKQKTKAADKLHAPSAAVLVVDDNSVNLFVAKSLLGTFGIEPTCVASGELAIKACENRSYDLILMDHMMPKMDGVEAMNIIREQFPAYRNVPVIAFTANAVEEARDLLLNAGMDDFLAKPVKGSDLEAILRKWLPAEKIG